MIKLREYIAEKLINTKVFEMAQSLDEYRKDIESMIDIILVHILLIMKSREENNDEFVNHWKKEIRGFLIDLCKKNLKVKDNYKVRLKHLNSVIKDKLDYETNDNILWGLYKKLYEEGYDLDDENVYNIFLELFHSFQDNYLDELIDILAKRDFNEIKKFIDKL